MSSTTDKNLSGDVVQAHELTKKFGEEVAVDSLTMHVPRGTIFGFIGPSGCGKTTTVRLINGSPQTYLRRCQCPRQEPL